MSGFHHDVPKLGWSGPAGSGRVFVGHRDREQSGRPTAGPPTVALGVLEQLTHIHDACHLDIELALFCPGDIKFTICS